MAEVEVPGLADMIYDSEEQLEPENGKLVSGEVPDWLNGSFYRAGPAKFNLGDGFKVETFYDGLAMIARFQVSGGGVTLRKRFVQTLAYKKAMKHKKLVFTEFGTRAYPDPDKGFFTRLVAACLPTDMTDNCFNNIYHVNGQLIAAAETALVTRMDPEDLQTIEQVDLSKSLGVNLCCSHPVTDTDGSIYTMGITFMPTFKYQLNRIPPAESAADGNEAFAKSKCLLSMSSSWMTSYSYYHSFGLTENYIVFMEQPLLMVLSKIMYMVVKGNSLKDAMDWRPEHKVKVYVVHKDTGKLIKTKYITDVAFFQNHIANAYEQDGQIVLDMVTHEAPGIFHGLYLKNMEQNRMSGEPGRVTRLVIPVADDIKTLPEDKNLVTLPNTTATARRKGDTVTLTIDLFPEEGVEYPTINPLYRGRPYRYAYVSCLYNQGFFKNAIGRLDVTTREWTLWRGEAATYPSEATFVPRPGGTAETDGVLLTTLLGTGGRADQLVIVDPASMQPLARLEFACRIPTMVHGLWLPDEKVTKRSQ